MLFEACVRYFTKFLFFHQKIALQKLWKMLFFLSHLKSSFHSQDIHIFVIFGWGTHLYMSLFLSICLSVCCAPYLRNHTYLSDHIYWYTCEMISPGIFFILFKFWFFCAVRGGKREKNDPKGKTITSVMHHIWGKV